MSDYSQIAFAVSEDGSQLGIFFAGKLQGTAPIASQVNPPATYLRPNGVWTYLRPNGVSNYLRPA